MCKRPIPVSKQENGYLLLIFDILKNSQIFNVKGVSSLLTLALNAAAVVGVGARGRVEVETWRDGERELTTVGGEQRSREQGTCDNVTL